VAGPRPIGTKITLDLARVGTIIAEMPETTPDSPDDFAALLKRLPPDLDVEALARQTKAFQRSRGIKSGTTLLRLALAWGCGHRSTQHLAAWAGEYGIAHVTDAALIQRFHRAVPFLQALGRRLLSRVGEAPSWHGRTVRIADGTSLSQPGSKGTDWRIHCVFDLGRGGFSHLAVTDSHGGEALDRGKPVPGEIRIADRGYANAQAWQRFLESRDEAVDFIVRMRWRSIKLIDANGTDFSLIAWLTAHPGEPDQREITVLARSGKHRTPMPIRLIARRKPADAADKARRAVRRRASRRQSNTDPRSYVAADWIVVATSLPADLFPADEVLAAYRLRWQVELAIKRMKSLLGMGDIRTRTPDGTQCWLYANLIVALLSDDLGQDFLASFPSGPR
jgi:hypothetical protein